MQGATALVKQQLGTSITEQMAHAGDLSAPNPKVAM